MISQAETVVLERQWRQLAEHPGEKNQEFDVSLSLPVIIGCTGESQPYIMLLTKERPHPFVKLESVDVRIGKRISPIDENWSLTFVLQDWGLLHAFAEICLVFVERIKDASSQHAALRSIYSTIDQWQRLLKAARQSEQLSVLRGVCGELLAAIEIMKLTDKSMESICKAWSGPYSMPQDYSFDSERHYWEVKSIHSSAKQLLISSSAQLDTTDREINLVVVPLDSPDGSGKKRLISLPKLIDKLRNGSDNPSQVSFCIDNGLALLGIDPNSDMCQHSMFSVGQVAVYGVTDGFPRLSMASVPEGVTELTYAIERSKIKPFITHVDDDVLHLAEG
ncbi:MAG: PD-(D/E)XK motif protein [Bifidobacteriales bacterium]|nr:PD-(D/E)XK motif protein [Bifidobacteriales bacterium]